MRYTILFCSTEANNFFKSYTGLLLKKLVCGVDRFLTNLLPCSTEANNVSTDLQLEQLRCSYLLHRKQRMSNVPKGHYSAPAVLTPLA